ncbi:MAG: high light inducible protein [Synechococcales cyanobacterium T60_A2020_003]|nr:high light inducible protein [Synechococcales cyanobacterium T60_A2020_003]
MTNDTPVQNVPEPDTEQPLEPAPAFGWTRYAELINGRFAMIGFAALIVIELLTHQDFFSWIGLR